MQPSSLSDPIRPPIAPAERLAINFPRSLDRGFLWELGRASLEITRRTISRSKSSFSCPN